MKLKIEIPKEYCSKAKEEIKNIIKELEKDSSIIKLDKSAILALAAYLNKFYTAEATSFKVDLVLYNKDGSVRQPHPCVKQMDDAAKGRDKLLKELGMTPLSRVKAGKEPEEEPTALEKFAMDRKLERR